MLPEQMSRAFFAVARELLPDLCKSDKAKQAQGTAPQPALVYMIGHLAPAALHNISDLSVVTYRSAARPPQRMRLDLLCSRQI